MDEIAADPPLRTDTLELPAWKNIIGFISAFLLAIIMLAAGIWKATDPMEFATRLNQLLVPAMFCLPLSLSLAVGETFTGILLIVPRFRRWGAILSLLELFAFVAYLGINYSRLNGEDCSCFPWVHRAVGPAFFIGDGVMVLFAVFALIWARPSRSIRGAAIILGIVVVFVAASYGVAVNQQRGLQAPDSILVEGEPYSLQEGRILLYFYDPECTTCLFGAQQMSTFTWINTKFVAVPTDKLPFAQQFLDAAQWQIPISTDAEKLRETFSFGDPPYGALLENGRQVVGLTLYEGDEPRATLKELGFIE